MTMDDGLRQIYIELNERIAALIADGLRWDDTDRIEDSFVYRGLIFDEKEGLTRALRTGNFRAALTAINRHIRSLEEQYGGYADWDEARKEAYGYILAFLYWAQATCYVLSSRAPRARDESLPRARAIAECTPALLAQLAHVQRAVEAETTDGEPARIT